MNVKRNEQNAFTIIEVVLVLAVAALIFLMVFVAFPSLQTNQRDTERKNDVAIVASAMATYLGNNRGTPPADLARTDKNATNRTGLMLYIDRISQYGFVTVTSSTAALNGTFPISPDLDTVQVVKKAGCGTSSTTSQTLVGSTSRQFAVVGKLEGGGGTYFCQDS